MCYLLVVVRSVLFVDVSLPFCNCSLCARRCLLCVVWCVVRWNVCGVSVYSVLVATC